MKLKERAKPVFVFEPDLIFSSKFECLSRLVEEDFRIFSELTTLLEHAYGEKPAAFIINLDVTDPKAVQTMLAFGAPVMAYYSHVNSQTAHAAVESGVRPVVTRGTFVANAESLVRELLSLRR